MKIFTLFKKFSSKVVAIPPNLKAKNLVKDNGKKSSPVYNLLKTGKLVNSKNEIENLSMKQDYETILDKASNEMLLNSFKLHENPNSSELQELYIYLSKILKMNQASMFITYLNETKAKFESDEIENTKEIFKPFLDKIYNLTDSKEINENIISLLSKVSISEIKSDEIFKQSSFLPRSGVDNLHAAIGYSNFSTSLENHMSVFTTPQTSDSPTEDFKDAFILQYEYNFRRPLLMQDNQHKSKFDKSEYVYFHMMPMLYPVMETSTKEISIKHITHQFIQKAKVNLGYDQSEVCKDWVKKYLKSSLGDTSDDVADVRVFHVYANKNKQMHDYQDTMDNEMIDYLFSNIEPVSEKAISKYRNFKSTSLVTKEIFTMDKYINETKYLHYRQIEIEREIEEYKSSPLFCNGILRFKNRKAKVEFLKSGAGLFGVHLQGRNVRFYDSDFCNVLEFKHFDADDYTMNDVMNLINNTLKLQDYEGDQFNLPEYFSDFKVGKIDTETTVYLRCNGFLSAYEIYNKLNAKSAYKQTRVKLMKPLVRYYENKFICGFDLVLQNTLKHFNKSVKIDTNYLNESSPKDPKDIYI